MPFLFQGDFRVNSTIINGVQYVTFSFFDGDKLIFDKVGDIIKQSYKLSIADGVTNKSLPGNGIAIEKG